MQGSLLAVLVLSVLLAALARRFNASAPLALVVAGLIVSAVPGFKDIELDPELVLYVLLPPLLWSAGLESSYVNLKRNIRPIGLLAVGLPLATTFAVGFVAFKTVPDLTVAAALTLGAIVAPPDAVSATAVGRRLGLPRRVMTLLGGESLLNDATALTAYKVALAAAIGSAATWSKGLGTFALAAGGGVAIGIALGAVIALIRHRLKDPLVESALGLVAPFVIYLTAEEVARIRGACRCGRRADARPTVAARRLRDPTAGPGGVEGRSAAAGVVRVPDDRPSAANGDRRARRHLRVGDRGVIGGRARDGHRRANRVGVHVRLPAEDAVVTHQGA